MNERQRSPLPLNLTPRAIGLVVGSMKETGSKIKGAALRLLPGFPKTLPVVQRANRASATDVDGFPSFMGSNGGWARSEYGEYYATSVPVYSAIRLRAEALSRAPAVVYRTDASGTLYRSNKPARADTRLARAVSFFPQG